MLKDYFLLTLLNYRQDGASKESAVMLCNRRSRDMRCMAYFT